LKFDLFHVNTEKKSDRLTRVRRTFFLIHQKYASNQNDLCKYPMMILLHGNYFVNHLARKQKKRQNLEEKS